MIASFAGRKVANEPSQLEFHASGKLRGTCTRLCTLISDENIVISDYATLYTAFHLLSFWKKRAYSVFLRLVFHPRIFSRSSLIYIYVCISYQCLFENNRFCSYEFTVRVYSQTLTRGSESSRSSHVVIRVLLSRSLLAIFKMSPHLVCTKELKL